MSIPPRPLPPGVWGVVATPFAGSTLDVDESALARLVERYAELGVTGLTVLGVFGEAAQLSRAERRAVLEVVRDDTADRHVRRQLAEQQMATARGS
ncbi:dihydrodipicolinate synthase family protein, partial [Streptomyces asiaticus]